MMSRPGPWIGCAAAALLLVSVFSLDAQQPRRKKKPEAAEPNPKLVKVTTQVAGIISPAFRLKVGDRVEAGQVLVQLEHPLAEQDLIKKEAKLRAAEAELRAARAIMDENRSRLDVSRTLHKNGAISREELMLNQSTFEKYQHEAAIKEELVKVVKTDSDRARLIVNLHQLRSPVNGVVRAIYKMRGEGVKALESILLIEETGAKE